MPQDKTQKPFETVNYHYDYPEGLDLKPGSELHDDLAAEILKRGTDSQSAMQGRLDSWKHIDRQRTAYVPLDVEEKRVRSNDERKPVSLVVPTSFAVKETILTYLVSVFLQRPYFPLSPQGPEDIVGVLLMEKDIDIQTIRSAYALAIHIMLSDALDYGVGYCSPQWEVRQGGEGETLYEGIRGENIDPYRALPDPNVPAQKIQEGECFGWMDYDNRMNLLEAERYDDREWTNVKYLAHVDGRSSLMPAESDTGRQERWGASDWRNTHGTMVQNLVHLQHEYINLIPKEWKIGDSEYPEKWLFTLAGDQIICRAKPLGLRHDRFPVVSCSPDFDGYSVWPCSRMEAILPSQEALNYIVSSRLEFIRKAKKNIFVLDPYIISADSVRQFEEGGYAYVRRPFQGRFGATREGMQQLNINDVTQQHFADMTMLSDTIWRASGAIDTLQGVIRAGSERRTAEEIRTVRAAGMSRMDRMVRVIDEMAMMPMSNMIASMTQQLKRQESFVRELGDWESRLRDEYGIESDNGFYRVNPSQLQVHYDVLPTAKTAPGGENAQAWVTVFDSLQRTQNPEILQRLDMYRIFKHVARLLGATNVQEFERREVPRTNVRAEDMEQIQPQVEQGNYVPIEEYMAAAGGSY